MTSSQLRRLSNRVSRTAARMTRYAAEHDVPVGELANAQLPWFEVRAADSSAAGDGTSPAADAATILIYDEIGGSFGTNAKSFVKELDQISASTIKLRINSPGGNVFDALTIANSLRHHPARVVCYVDGIAASAASVVAMGADDLVMMPGAELMIHDASAMGDGNAADMGKLATFLDRQSDNIATLYQARGGGDVADWRALMRDETWMYGQEAVGFGLADRVEGVRGDLPAGAEEKLTRGHDLGQYRYAGRAQAPVPQWRVAVASGGAVKRSAPGRSRPTSGRAAAAQARAAHGAGGMSERTLPLEVGARREAPAPVRQMRAKLETRNGKQLYRLSGVASVTDTPYPMWDHFGEYDEVVAREAFAATLAAEPDVAYLLNHRGMTMARTTNSTLELGMTDDGFEYVAWLNPERQDVKDLITAVEDENITENSFAFLIEDGVWNEDFTEFRITRLNLHRGDVSAVNYGANPYTSIAARSNEILAELDRLPAGAARAALERLAARDDTTVADMRGAEINKRVAAALEALPGQIRAAVAERPAPAPVNDPAPTPAPVDDLTYFEALAQL